MDTSKRHNVLRWSELGLSLLLTAVTIAVHGAFLRHAGGLWRDEVQMVNLATMPTLAELWRLLEFDTYPLLWQVTIRLWSGVGLGGTDQGLRLLGFLVGLGIVGMLWYASWRVNRAVPLLSLLLAGLSPTVIIYGDSLRGYGMGALTMLLLIGVFWWLVEDPTRRRLVVAAIIAVIAVQSSFFNAVPLFALGMAAAVVQLYRRDWKTAGVIIGIGILAAGSLLPYLDPISRQYHWNDIVRYPLTQWQYLQKFGAAVNFAIPFMGWVWGITTAAALVCSFYRFTRPGDTNQPDLRERALFLGVALLLGVGAFYAFLFSAKLPTQIWYYIPLIGFLAALSDAAVQLVFVSKPWVRGLRLCLVAILAIAIVPPVWRSVHVRMTNLDVVARHLEQVAGKDDLILVNPWHPAITFSRYYHGVAPWLTLPNLSEYRVQRFDLLRERMSQPDPLRPVLNRVAATLRAGNRLWVIGNLELLGPGELPGDLLPYPKGGANESPYIANWSRQTGYFLQQYADSFYPATPEINAQVHKFENPELARVEGWH